MTSLVKLILIDKDAWKTNFSESEFVSPFHDIEIMELFLKAFGGNVTLYLARIKNKRWLIPVFTGTPWAASPCFFTVSSIGYGGVLPLQTIEHTEEEIHAVKTIIREIETETGLSFSKGQLFPATQWEAIHSQYNLSETLVLNLLPDVQKTFNEVLTGNVRTSIRKAEKAGVCISEPQSMDDLLEAHQLIVSTQNLVGAGYNTPLDILRGIFYNNNLPAKIFIASHHKKIIGNVILLTNKTQSFHWVHGWDRSYASLCANQLLIWHMAKECIKNGCLTLNLGSSHSVQLKLAKLKWGAIPMKILTLGNHNIN